MTSKKPTAEEAKWLQKTVANDLMRLWWKWATNPPKTDEDMDRLLMEFDKECKAHKPESPILEKLVTELYVDFMRDIDRRLEDGKTE